MSDMKSASWDHAHFLQAPVGLTTRDTQYCLPTTVLAGKYCSN